MDALKKAEHAKQQGQAAPAGVATGTLLELEPPAEAGKTAPVSLPELPMQLEVLDQEFMAHAETSARPGQAKGPPRSAGAAKPDSSQAAPTGATSNAQAAAQNVFAAKQSSRSNKSFAIAVGLATVVAAAGIGIYFWLQLRPSSGLGGPAATLPPVRTAPQPAQQPVPSPPLAAPAQPSMPVPQQVPLAGAAPVPPALPALPSRAAPATPEPRTAPADEPIRIATARLKTNPALTQGFDAFSAGNLATARDSYEQVLKAEPKNTDALHGMAAIALREGRLDQAEAYYLRVIEADPKDALAHASLVGLRSQGDPTTTESRLKTMLAVQPAVPHLHFALGNLYAGQRRWREAQQAYFDAVTGDPTHPDYLFNLAVSLDQLHQDRLAAQYYNQALAAAAHRPAGFDQVQVGVRLRELQP